MISSEAFTRSMAPGRPVRRAEIASLAAYVPPRLLTNADFDRTSPLTVIMIIR